MSSRLIFSAPSAPFEIERVVLFLEVTEVAKNFVEQFVQRQPARFGVSRNLAKHDYCGIPILVPHEIGAAVTIALFRPQKRRTTIFADAAGVFPLPVAHGSFAFR